MTTRGVAPRPRKRKRRLVDQTGGGWNRIANWLAGLESLRACSPREQLEGFLT